MLGDFNVVRKISEKGGLNIRGSSTNREVEVFNNFIKIAQCKYVCII